MCNVHQAGTVSTPQPSVQIDVQRNLTRYYRPHPPIKILIVLMVVTHPNVELDLLIGDCFDIEADGGNGSDIVGQFHLVEDSWQNHTAINKTTTTHVVNDRYNREV